MKGRVRPEESLMYGLVDLTFELARRTQTMVADVLSELDVTESLADALWQLDPHRAAPSMRELASRLDCDPSTVTFLADRLDERGLVERVADPSNRRVKTLLLTPKGVRVRSLLVEAVTTRSPLVRLTGEEQALLRELLAKAMGANPAGG
jgi:DNA-binding MarR family transcriptional regulator